MVLSFSSGAMQKKKKNSKLSVASVQKSPRKCLLLNAWKNDHGIYTSPSYLYAAATLQ